MTRRCVVWLSPFAEKRLNKLPKHILEAYHHWVRTVEFEGIRETRKLPGFHDEPLKGKRSGERSVRLSRSYRVIYIEDDRQSVTMIGVMEINKHDY